jgi:hypothetical protein
MKKFFVFSSLMVVLSTLFTGCASTPYTTPEEVINIEDQFFSDTEKQVFDTADDAKEYIEAQKKAAKFEYGGGGVSAYATAAYTMNARLQYNNTTPTQIVVEYINTKSDNGIQSWLLIIITSNYGTFVEEAGYLPHGYQWGRVQTRKYLQNNKVSLKLVKPTFYGGGRMWADITGTVK